MIKIINAEKSFGSYVVFKNLNLIINQPGLYIIQGDSGSGKSTLLNMIANYDLFDAGEIEISKNIATIFQNYELIQELTVFENIQFIYEGTNLHKRIISQLGIDEFLDFYPNELSGGQKQRVGIARALALDPSIILCDEPTESLDIDNKKIVMNVLKELSKDRIVIVATHDQMMIDVYADCIFQIKNKKLYQLNDYSSKFKLFKEEKKIIKEKNVSKLIHKILYKRTILSSFVIVILISVLQQLILYEKQLFYVPETTNVVNANVLYIEKLQLHIDYNLLELNEAEIKPYVYFENIKIEDKKYPYEMFPYIENSLKMMGQQPSKNAVVINQCLAEIIQDWKSKHLSATYTIGSNEYTMDFKIVGVVYEYDRTIPMIYYDMASIENELKEKEIPKGKYPDIEEERNYYTLLQKKGTHYQVGIRYEELDDYFEKCEGVASMRLRNPLYNQRKYFKEDSVIYQLMFKLFEIILFVGIIAFITIFLMKDTNYYLSICAILASVQFSLSMIKKYYFIEKIKYLFIFLIVFVFGALMIQIDSYSFVDIKLLFGIVINIVLYYLVVLTVNMRKLQMKNISNILKDDKD